MSKTHELKCWPEYFDAVDSNLKPFEIRKNDRDYRQHDVLRLREWFPHTKQYSGRECHVIVVAMWENVPGLLPDHVAMAVAPIETDPF